MSDPDFGTEVSTRLQTRDRDVSAVCLKFYVYINYTRGKTIEREETEEEALAGSQTDKSQEKGKEKEEKIGGTQGENERNGCRVRKGKRKRERDNKTAVNESLPAVQTD